MKHPALYERLSLDRMLANRVVFQKIDSMSTTFEGQDHWEMVREIISPYAEHLVDDDAMAEQLEPIKMLRGNGRYAAEIPRVALVATGDKQA